MENFYRLEETNEAIGIWPSLESIVKKREEEEFKSQIKWDLRDMSANYNVYTLFGTCFKKPIQFFVK